MSSSPIVSSILFLLLFVISLHMDEAFGAQTEIRKLKETIKMRRNSEGNGYKSSKMYVPPSVSRQCGAARQLVTTYRPYDEIDGDTSTYFCKECVSTLAGSVCIIKHCTITRTCDTFNGSPDTCHESHQCVRCGN